MTCQNIISTEFESLINNNEIVLIDFWAEWCAPCKQFAMVYEKISEQYPSIKFLKVNTAEQQELAELFEIRSIPYLMIFKQGIVIYANAGSIPESTLKELIQQAIEVDVSEIQAQIENGEAP